MFIPDKNKWSNLTTTTPPTMSHTNPRSSNRTKSGVILDAPAPPLSLLAGDDVGTVDNGDAEDWRRFSEAGLLDEAAMERKDQQAVFEKIAKLEREV